LKLLSPQPDVPPLSIAQRSSVLVFTLAALASLPLIFTVRPLFIPLIVCLSCLTAVSRLLYQARKTGAAVFATSVFALGMTIVLAALGYVR
jgi:hypothetical protein